MPPSPSTHTHPTHYTLHLSPLTLTHSSHSRLTSHTRSHIPPPYMDKQRYCRGYIARYFFHRRLYSIVKIQSLVRMIVARKKVELMRIEKRKREEAERLRKEEEERLKKKMKEEEARREAERLHQVRVGGGEWEGTRVRGGGGGVGGG